MDWKKLTPEEQERVKEEGRRKRDEEKKRKQDEREKEKEKVFSLSHLLWNYSHMKAEEKIKVESFLKGRGVTMYNELFRFNSFTL